METTRAFIEDIEKRLHRAPGITEDHTPQFSTDGFGPYQPVIRDVFGSTAKHGVLVKNYVNPEVGRYQPPDLVRAERTNIRGIRDLATICTSHVERCNLTIQTFIKRCARLALGFSKKFENLCAATALHVGVYNYVRVHRSLRMTPAMAAGVTDTLWDMGRFYDEVAAHGEQVKRTAKVKRLIDRLKRPE